MSVFILMELYRLTYHWDRVMHVSVSKLITIGADNGLSPQILSKICTFSLKKMHLKMSDNWWPFCLGLNVLTIEMIDNPNQLPLSWVYFANTPVLLMLCFVGKNVPKVQSRSRVGTMGLVSLCKSLISESIVWVWFHFVKFLLQEVLHVLFSLDCILLFKQELQRSYTFWYC